MSDFECLPIGTAARLTQLEAEVERLRAQREQRNNGFMNDETGWLIEMKLGDGLLWWSGEFDRADDKYQHARLIARMVCDPGHAVRFSRREDAQRVLDSMRGARPCPVLARAPELYSVQEHIWVAPAQQAEPVAPSGWAYRYPDGIRFNDGCEVNGCRPIEAIPYWLGAPPAQQAEPVCRSDGRCQYAIDSGAEGLGHCPKGKCVMPEAGQQDESVVWQERQSRRVSKDGKITEWSPWYESKGPSPDYVDPENPRIEVTYQWRRLYTAPPRREWKGLTDEEIAFCRFEARVETGPFKRDGTTTTRLARAIETACREKNDAEGQR